MIVVMMIEATTMCGLLGRTGGRQERASRPEQSRRAGSADESILGCRFAVLRERDYPANRPAAREQHSGQSSRRSPSSSAVNPFCLLEYGLCLFWRRNELIGIKHLIVF